MNHFIFVLGVLFLNTLPVHAQEPSISKQKSVENGLRPKIVDSETSITHSNILEKMQQYQIPGLSVTIVNEGKIAWSQGYGHITNTTTSPSIDEHTLFQAASISKAFTAFGVLILVQEGKVSLDADVNLYLKRWKVPDSTYTETEKVTIRRLLSHTAGTSGPGFPGYSSNDQIPTLIEILEGKKPIVNTDPVVIVSIPGTEMKYSGGGTSIVQLLIEDVTGEHFDVWMQENVLKPLGMSESTFTQPLPASYSKHAAYGHEQNGNPVEGNWHIYPEMAAAGLWSTSHDLAQFVLYIQGALKGEKTTPLDPSYVKEMVTRQKIGDKEIDYGLGLYLLNHGKDLIFGHHGNDKGFLSHMMGYAYRGEGLVTMANSDSFMVWLLMDEMTNSVADTYGWPDFKPLTQGTLKSWVVSANDPTTDFPIQNLPYGVFKKKNSNETPRIGVAIGNSVFDFKAAIDEELLVGFDEDMIKALNKKTLNALMSFDKNHLNLLRSNLIELFREGSLIFSYNFSLRDKILVPMNEVDLLMPAHVGDYTDFYASLHHAKNVGSIMRPDNPLMPNYKHMPIGYHGRSSSIIVSGTPIIWPSGQILDAHGKPVWSESQTLDFELEMGAFIGQGNAQGSPIAIESAKSHLFGFVLLNDWSARDIQKWEYQPLGPFNGKNFATTISPWVVTAEALEPYRIQTSARAKEDPPLLEYLASDSLSSYDIHLEAYISSETMRHNHMQPLLICQGNMSTLYWTFEQMISQHTSSGANLQSGDLLGSGTISGPSPESLGCFLERKSFELPPLELPDGTTRVFLQDGDEIVLKGYAHKEGYPKIGFGECRGIVSKKK